MTDSEILDKAAQAGMKRTWTGAMKGGVIELENFARLMSDEIRQELVKLRDESFRLEQYALKKNSENVDLYMRLKKFEKKEAARKVTKARKRKRKNGA